MQDEDGIVGRFIGLLDHLERHPSMFTMDFGYAAAINFLFGFCEAERHYGHEGVLGGFQSFISRRLGEEMNTHWAYVIREILAEGADAKALTLLFSLLREYLQEKLAESDAH